MWDSPSSFEVWARSFAPYFNAASQPHPDPELIYDILAGAVRWSDETPSYPEVLGAKPLWLLRPILAHRTRTILGLPSEDSELWEIARAHFPDWVGFAPDRCHPSAEVLELIRAEMARGERETRKLTRWIDRFGDSCPPATAGED